MQEGKNNRRLNGRALPSLVVRGSIEPRPDGDKQATGLLLRRLSPGKKSFVTLRLAHERPCSAVALSLQSCFSEDESHPSQEPEEREDRGASRRGRCRAAPCFAERKVSRRFAPRLASPCFPSVAAHKLVVL